ncbi:hypothetical protein NMG60_11036281 [Bertholletia excelsa]
MSLMGFHNLFCLFKLNIETVQADESLLTMLTLNLLTVVLPPLNVTSLAKIHCLDKFLLSGGDYQPLHQKISR